MAELTQEEKKVQELEYLRNKKKFMDNLPHLYGQKFYPWSREFHDSTDKDTLLLCGNQVGKTSIQLKKMINWATNVELWETLWPATVKQGKTPNVFWFLITDLNTATALFHDKLVPEFLPRGELINHPRYGWKAHFRNRQISMIEFNTGVKIYFQAYSKNSAMMQSATVYALFCFVAGTKVLTDQGWRNVEEIAVGDNVHTNSGIHRVKGNMSSVKNTHRLELDNGSVVEGTTDHPIATYNRGWAELGNLTAEDEVCVLPMWRTLRTLLNIRERLTRDTSVVTIQGITTTDPKKICGFIGKFGNITTVLYQRVNIFIIKTLIRLITRFQTYSVSLERNITKSIKLLSGNKRNTKNTSVKNVEKSSLLVLLKRDLKSIVPPIAKGRTVSLVRRKSLLGTVRNVVRHLILPMKEIPRSIVRKYVVLGQAINISANSVVKSFLILIRSKLFVAQVVVPSGTTQTEVQTRRWYANTAVRCLRLFRVRWIGSSAQRNVTEPIDQRTTIHQSGLFNGTVHGVWDHSSVIETAANNTAQKAVISKVATTKDMGDQEVFNLTVEGVPEYYASGIKVHNCDEELPEHIHGELKFRTAAVDGYFSMVFTATLGQALWYKAFERIGEKDETFKHAKKITATVFDCLEYEDGDTNTPWTVEKIKDLEMSCSTENEIQKRVYGRFVMDEGLVLSEFISARHMIEPYELNFKKHEIYSGVDIGSGGKSGHKGACIFIAVNEDYTHGVIFKGWKGNNRETTTSADILDIYRKKRGNILMAAQYYDWASKDFHTFATRAGENFQKANKDHDSGWETMNTLLKLGMLDVFDIDELQPFRYEAGTLTHEGLRKKNHADDDMLDAARYAVTSIPWDITKVVQFHKDPEFKKKEVIKSEVEIRREIVFSKEEEEYHHDIESEMSEWNELY